MNFIEQLVRESLPVPDRREFYQWGAENVDFGNSEAFKGAYNVENVPWTRDVLRALKNPRKRKVSVVMPPQESGKTKMAELFLCARIVNEPAKMAFNAFNDVSVSRWAETRWPQMMNCCPALKKKLSTNRHHTKTRRIIFPNGTFLIIQGAENEANRQSDSVEVQVNDECMLWLGTWLSEMHARTRAYKETCKILNIGLGGTIGSEWHQEFANGTQSEWSHHCPTCQQLFQYRFNLRDREGSNIHFDKRVVTYSSDQVWDFSRFAETVYVTCTNCGVRIDYDPHLLARMNRRGQYVEMNPNGDPEIASFHANSFAIGRRPWAKILEGWIKATMGRSVFNTEQLKQFITAELAEFWEERPIIVRKSVATGDFTRREMKDPKFWPDEWIRLMSIDNQHGGKNDIPHRWFVCRAFARDGRSRLVDCGRINEWEEVRAKQLELGVLDPTPGRPGPWVVVDRQHDPAKVDEVCARYKWHGMMGQDTEKYRHEAGTMFAPEEAMDFYFSDERQIDIGFGTVDGGRQSAYYYLYAKQKIEEILSSLRNGSAESWEAPKDLAEFAPEYFEHINSHHQIMESTKNGEKLMWRGIGHTPDHMHDCEGMLTVLGLMAGVFKR